MPEGKSYRLIGTHQEDLAGGRVIAPGQSASLSKEELDDDNVKRLIEEGLLIPNDEPENKGSGRKADAGKEGDD